MSSKALTLTFILLSLVHYVHSQALDTDNFLVVAVSDVSKGSIYHVTYAPRAIIELTPANKPYAVAYDPTTKFVYWSDIQYPGRIYRISLLSRNNSEIFNGGSAQFHGLTVDTEHQKLYYTDYTDKLRRLGEMSTDGGDHRVLNLTSGSRPHDIVVDSFNRMLYWTDWSDVHPGIYRSPISNFSSQPLITTDIVEPIALAVDFTAGIMYWGDSKLDRIEMANLNGSGREVLVNQSSPHGGYTAFALDTQYLYFTDGSNFRASAENSGHVLIMDRSSLQLSTYDSGITFTRAFGLIRFAAPATPSSTAEAIMTTSALYTTLTTVADGGTDTQTLTIIIVACCAAVVVVIVVLVICICILALRKWRPKVIQNIILDERRRQGDEEQQHQQVSPVTSTRTSQSLSRYPTSGIYEDIEDIDIQEDGYAKLVHSPGDEQVSREPELPNGDAQPSTSNDNTSQPEPDHVYSRSLPTDDVDF